MPNIRRALLMLLWGVLLLGATGVALAQLPLPVTPAAAADPALLMAPPAAEPPEVHLHKHVATRLPMQASAAGHAPYVNTANVDLPAGLLPVLLAALAQQPEGATQFLLASLRRGVDDTGEWALVSYAPVDGPHATELYIGKGQAARLLLAQRTEQGWVAHTQVGAGFNALLAQAPASFISPDAKALFLAQRRPSVMSTVDYKWPWAIGLSWRWMQGWHYKSAHDIGTDGNDKRVLASADGVITYVCQGNIGAAVRVKHADGQEVGYWHIDAGQLAPGIAVLQTVRQGQVLGTLRPGSWTDTQGCQQYTSQSANSAHVHWELPGDFTVEGWSISANSSAFSKESVTKTCNGGCWQAANFFTSSNNPSGNPTPTPTATASPTPTSTPLPVQLSILPSTVFTKVGQAITLQLGISNTGNLTGVSYSLAYSSNVALTNLTTTTPTSVELPLPPLIIAHAQFSTTQYGIAGVNFATVTVTGTNGLTREVKTTGAHIYVGGCAGDVDLDSAITLTDVQQIGLHWPSQISDTLYAADYDLDINSKIDLSDVQRVAYRAGSTCVSPPAEPITASAAMTGTAPVITLTMQPMSVTTFVGNIFTVTVMISAVAPITEAMNLGAFALELTHAMTALRVLTITPGVDLLSSGRPFVPLLSGHEVGMVSLGISPTLSVSETLTNAIWATLTVQALEVGVHPWQIAQVYVTDSHGWPIPATGTAELQLEVTDGQRVWLPVLSK